MKKRFSTGSYVSLLGSPRVFVHDVANLPSFWITSKFVKGIDKYDRSLPLAREDDVVFLKYRPDSTYLKWLRSIGMGTKNVIYVRGKKNQPLTERLMRPSVKKKLDRILGKKKCQAILSVYFSSNKELELSKFLGIPIYANPKLSTLLNNKLYFHKLCEKIGVPTIKADIYKPEEGAVKLKILIQKRLKETGVDFIQGELGSSGSASHIVESDYDIEKIYHSLDKSERYMVEPFYRSNASPSTLWFITRSKSIYHLASSNQLLDKGIIHAGNELPGNFKHKPVIENGYKIAKKLAQLGFVGTFGVDFLQTARNTFAVECNPRVTGATYPWEIMKVLERKHGPVKVARAQHVHVPKKIRRFSQVKRKLKNLLYNGKHLDNIIFPFNTGPLKDGKFSIIATGGSSEAVDGLIKKVGEMLNS